MSQDQSIFNFPSHLTDNCFIRVHPRVLLIWQMNDEYSGKISSKVDFCAKTFPFIFIIMIENHSEMIYWTEWKVENKLIFFLLHESNKSSSEEA